MFTNNYVMIAHAMTGRQKNIYLPPGYQQYSVISDYTNALRSNAKFRYLHKLKYNKETSLLPDPYELTTLAGLTIRPSGPIYSSPISAAI